MPTSIALPSLTDMTAVVTGASRGIGRAIALELASAGAHVFVHARANRQGAEQTAERVRKMDRQSEVILCDIADPMTHEPLVEQAWCWRGGVDVWVNNAGVDVLTGEAARWPFEEKLQRLWQVDVMGTMCLSRLIGARMKERRALPSRAAIVNVGWDQAEHGMAGDSGEMFAATKGAVMAFSKSLAKSLAPEVRVNCVAPGWIKTAWGEQASQDWQRRAVEESLLGRWGSPEDVAGAVCYLASPAASFITGQILAVNGGFRGSS